MMIELVEIRKKILFLLMAVDSINGGHRLLFIYFGHLIFHTLTHSL